MVLRYNVTFNLVAQILKVQGLQWFLGYSVLILIVHVTTRKLLRTHTYI